MFWHIEFSCVYIVKHPGPCRQMKCPYLRTSDNWPKVSAGCALGASAEVLCAISGPLLSPEGVWPPTQQNTVMAEAFKIPRRYMQACGQSPSSVHSSMAGSGMLPKSTQQHLSNTSRVSIGKSDAGISASMDRHSWLLVPSGQGMAWEPVNIMLCYIIQSIIYCSILRYIITYNIIL